jgi:hypothetical protein
MGTTTIVAEAAEKIIERLDTLYGSNWRFSLFCINKAISQLVNESELTAEMAVSDYDALTGEVEAEWHRRKEQRRATR